MIRELADLIRSDRSIKAKRIEVKRNEFLIRPGTVERNIYIIVSGAVRVFYLTELEEHTIRFGYTDSIITSLPSFFTGGPSLFYIQAIRESEIEIVGKDEFEKFIRGHTNGLELYNQLLQELVGQQIEREIDLLTHSPLDRLRRVRTRSPQVFQEIPAKYIASYLRMTPETLSRLGKS